MEIILIGLVLMVATTALIIIRPVLNVMVRAANDHDVALMIAAWGLAVLFAGAWYVTVTILIGQINMGDLQWRQ